MIAKPTMTPSEQAAWEEIARTGELYRYARVHDPRLNENQRRWLSEYQARLAELAKEQRR